MLSVNLTLPVMKDTLFCGLTSIFWRSHIVEDKYRPQHIGQKEYYELGKTVSLMLRVCRSIFGSGKAVFLGSEFFAAKFITYLKAKGIYAASLINNRRYWTKGFPCDLIDTHF